MSRDGGKAVPISRPLVSFASAVVPRTSGRSDDLA